MSLLHRFKPAEKGPMEPYLRGLEKHEMDPGEGKPSGCTDDGSRSRKEPDLFDVVSYLLIA